MTEHRPVNKRANFGCAAHQSLTTTNIMPKIQICWNLFWRGGGGIGDKIADFENLTGLMALISTFATSEKMPIPHG